MMKKFLYVLIGAFLLSGLSLLYFRTGNPCGGYGNMTVCYAIPASRGFPNSVRLDQYNGDFLPSQSRIFPLIFYQTTGFIFNTIFYFLIISALYFGYSKLVKKTKKK